MATQKTGPQAPQKPQAPQATAAPGTSDESGKKKEKKPKVKRAAYPGLKNGDEVVKLETVPADYDLKKYRPLKRGDFKDESFFLEWKASEFEKRAAALRGEAAEYRKMGSVTDRAKAKRLLSVMKRLEDLRVSLAGDGVDVDALVKRFAEAQAAK